MRLTTGPEGQTAVYAGTIVRAPDGKILCQLRDNNPGIICPGKWTCCPGGLVEAHESPHDAAVRELREEFDINVSQPQILSMVIRPSGDYRGIYHAFLADLLTPIGLLRCHEGQAAEFLTLDTALQLPQHPVSRLFLQQYQQLKHTT